MLALSVRQPWAWAIIHAGKDVESRSWSTLYRGPLLIHASQKFDHGGYEWLRRHIYLLTSPLPRQDGFVRGGVIGRVQMRGCLQYSESPWFFGPYGFEFANPEPLPFYKCEGKLLLFNVSIP